MGRMDAEKRLVVRKWANRVAAGVFFLATMLGIAVLVVLIGAILRDGLPWLSWEFLTNFPSRIPEKAGIKSALFGSLWLMALTAPIAFVLGVATAIYLEEYAKPGRLTRIIQTNIHNLAGVPSIVFGILGLTLFVRGIGLGRSVLAGALTMALLVLPIIVVAAQEAIRAVPNSLRHASYALGATRWQTIRRVVLPAALPSILTGTILAMSRAIGETAPLIMIGALTFIAFVPTSPLDAFTVLPIQIFNWVSRPQEAFHHLAAAGIIVLLIVLLSMNLTAVLLRNTFQKRY
ncbi:phosphate ABC transporter permease PstA [Calditerricola satsumensis]|uniref:Phosphate transport system permease protein PstA n=2 Tax=Calditerricola satsumensis TaxID=373054 RepID=A0A8J3BES7_9BACI|nr:phosphate transport system permease protein PstA [Calditerricola satsumensis]